MAPPRPSGAHGGLVNVDEVSAPYGGSRMLVSSADVGGGADTREMVRRGPTARHDC
jgi:hypothetical protein